MYENEKKQLIEKVIAKGRVPIKSVGNFEDSFTIETVNGKTYLMLWFDDIDGSSGLERIIVN